MEAPGARGDPAGTGGAAAHGWGGSRVLPRPARGVWVPGEGMPGRVGGGGDPGWPCWRHTPLSSPAGPFPGDVVPGLLPGHAAAPWGRCGTGRCLMGGSFSPQSLFSLGFSSLFESLCWSRDTSQQIPCPPQSLSPGHTLGVCGFIFDGKQTRAVELFPPCRTSQGVPE